jgi:hypothetical protein
MFHDQARFVWQMKKQKKRANFNIAQSIVQMQLPWYASIASSSCHRRLPVVNSPCTVLSSGG